MSNEVAEKTPFPAALARLKKIPGWLLWRWVETKPGKITKPPFQPRFPERNASNRNPKHWSDFRTALLAMREGKADGIGFVVSACGEICWVDLDDCREKETGILSPWAADLVARCATYCEVTPSGTGIRIVGVLTGTLSAQAIHKPYRLAGGGRGEIFYKADRYVTVSGKRLSDSPDVLGPVDEIVSSILEQSVRVRDVAETPGRDLIPADGDDELLSEDLQGRLNLAGQQIKDYLAKLPPSDAVDADGAPWWSYDRWLSIIFAVHDETEGSEDGYALVNEWCSTTPHYDPDGLRGKWESARGSGGPSRVSFRSVVKLVNDWTRPEREKTLDALLGQMATAQNRNDLEDCKIAAQGLQVDSSTLRAMLIATYRTAFRRLTNSSLSEATAKKELAFRDPEITNMPRWLRSFCWVSGIGKFYDAHTGLLYSPASFDISFGKRFMTPEDLAQGADEPTVVPHKVAMNRYNVQEVAALGYLPLKDDEMVDDELDDDAGGEGEGPARIRRPRFYSVSGVRYVNRYNTRGAVQPLYGPFTKEQRADIQQIVALYRRVCGTKRDTAIFLSALRQVVVEKKRVRFCCVLSSAEGSGKTTAAVTIPGLLLGADNTGIYQPQVLTDKTDGAWMDGHLWKVIEELFVPHYAKAAVIELMKPVITNVTVSPRFMFFSP